MNNNILEKNYGAIYTLKSTSFNLYSPISEKAYLMLFTNGDFVSHEMKKDADGIFNIEIKGNLANTYYFYKLIQKGKEILTNDPFAKGVSLNSTFSAVVNDDEVKKIKKIPVKRNVPPIIYEVNIRDFTEDKHTNIKNKGKYLGFVEPRRETDGGHPAGLDYLKKLGITHVQLQPIHDYHGVDDLNPVSYNWGYDPISYFALEGSYAKDPANPLSRLLEFRKMVDELHKNGIKVIIDVVYNHIYDYKTSYLEKTYPGFYFRKYKDGKMDLSSGCGNVIASEKPFVRKMILDSLKYLLETFDVDGFRFDLMGLIDITTIKEAEKMVRSIKPDSLFYGEGWNMGDILKNNEKASSDNAKKLPGVGFFNNTFRDLLCGSAFDKKDGGFINGKEELVYDFEYHFFGSTLNMKYPGKFLNPQQSINYVECHDNHTVFDKIKMASGEDDETVLNKIKFANALTMFSLGYPFFHMGQEIGQTKHENDNTYNIAKINNMRWDIVDSRWDYVKYFCDLVKCRFSLSEYELSDYDEICKSFSCSIMPNNVFAVIVDRSVYNYTFVINASEKTKPYEFDDYKTIYFTPSGLIFKHKMKVKNFLVSPYSLYITVNDNKFKEE